MVFRGFLRVRVPVKNERFCPVFFVKKLFSKINNRKVPKKGGQKRSFFVTIINIKQRRQARQVSRHPGVGRDPSTEALAKVDCVADSEIYVRAPARTNSLRGRSSLSLGLGTALDHPQNFSNFAGPGTAV